MSLHEEFEQKFLSLINDYILIIENSYDKIDLHLKTKSINEYNWLLTYNYKSKYIYISYNNITNILNKKYNIYINRTFESLIIKILYNEFKLEIEKVVLNCHLENV